MTAVKPGLAAALCSACQHPARRHSPSLGCGVGECWCDGAAPAVDVPTPAPTAAELALLDARCRCGHGRTAHVQRSAGSGVPCTTCTCRQFHVAVEGVTYAPVAPKAEPTPPPAAAAPAPAVASAAAPEPVREQPAPRPVADPPPWLPGAGVPHVKPAPVVEVTTPDEDVVRQVDAIVAAGKAAAKRPRRTPARPAPTSCALGTDAVVGERDAVEEVAAAAVDEPVAATVRPAGPSAMYLSVLDTAAELLAEREPEPLDLAPFLGAALHYYSAWYCTRCYQRRHDPGRCCQRPLVPVHVVIFPRSTS